MIFFLKNQEAIITKLKSIPYKKTNLLKYLKQQLSKATTYNMLSKSKISTSSNVLNCCEALSDCHQELLFTEKRPVYEKKFKTTN